MCMTLDMLRPCWYNPNLSAYASLEVVHNYNGDPIAPFGTEVTVYETANQRATRGLSGIKGWYNGPTFEHYRCLKVCIPVTRGEHIAVTLTNSDSQEQPLRVKTAPKHAVAQHQKQPQSTPLARVRKTNITHLIPDDDYGNLPPPKPHPT
eukprot:1970339-Ditylum_brightwellii.AAC.1